MQHDAEKCEACRALLVDLDRDQLIAAVLQLLAWVEQGSGSLCAPHLAPLDEESLPIPTAA